VHLHDKVPVLILHVLKADIPQYTGIVNEHVYPAESLDSRVDDGFAVLYTVVVCYRLSACSFDLVDDGIGSL